MADEAGDDLPRGPEEPVRDDRGAGPDSESRALEVGKREGLEVSAAKNEFSGGVMPAREADSPTAATEALRELADLVENRIPPGYRQAAFRALASWQLGSAGGTVAAAPVSSPAEPYALHPATTSSEAVAVAGRRGTGRLDLSPYATILGAAGRMLHKSLVALAVSRSQLGINWLTPAEIERFLTERARVRSAYRTNISNALSGARHLVDRRRRGRGYEYRITQPGRDLLEREVRLGADG